MGERDRPNNLWPLDPDELRQQIMEADIGARNHVLIAEFHQAQADNLRLWARLNEIPVPPPLLSQPESSATSRSIISEAAVLRVKDYMQKRGLTQAAFAHEAHIDERTLGRVLKKPYKASSGTWDEIAGAMKTTSEQLRKL